MTNHQSSRSSSSSCLRSRKWRQRSSSTMHWLLISLTLVTSLLASTTLCIPQNQQQHQPQRKSQQPPDSPEDGSRTSVGPDPTSAAGAQFQCPEQFGYYMDTRDCTKYYVCVFGEVLHESCTGGLRFSRELQTCDWPRNVECKQDNSTITERSSLGADVGSQQATEVQLAENKNEQQVTAGGQQSTTSSEANARSPKGSQMVFADEGSDPQQPSFDETVSPVITPDGTIHLHDGSGGTFGLGRAPLDSSQSVDVFVKPMTSLAPVSESPKQRQLASQQRQTVASSTTATSTTNGPQHQQVNSRQPPQLSGSGGGEETSLMRSTAAQPTIAATATTTGADEVESGEQPTESSESVGSGSDNGTGESSSVESSPTGEREELTAREGAADEGELEGEGEDAVSAPTTGYVPPFSTSAQHVTSGSRRQQTNLPTTVTDKDGVSFDFVDDSTESGSGGGDAASTGAGEISGSTHSGESQQVSPRDNEREGAERAGQEEREEEELAEHQARQSQRRQNQTLSLHPHQHLQQQQQQKALLTQQTLAQNQNNRQSRMSNFQQQQQHHQHQQQQQLSNKLTDNRQQHTNLAFPQRNSQPPTSVHHHQHLNHVNFNDSSKIIRLQAASHQPVVDLPGLLDESSSMQSDAAASFPQQQFPSPRSQNLVFSERPPFAGTLSQDEDGMMLDDGRSLSSSSLAPSQKQRFLDTSEPVQNFMAAPRRPRPPKRQQIPSGAGRGAVHSNSFRPANFSSSSSSFQHPHHNQPALSTTSQSGSFLVSREPPTPFVESDALAGGPPLMMMRGNSGARQAAPQQRSPTIQPRAFSSSSSTSSSFPTGTGPPPPALRRPGGNRHFSEPAGSARSSQGQQKPGGSDPSSTLLTSQLPAAISAAAGARANGLQQARRAHISQLQLQPGAGSATTNLGSSSLLAPTPPTTTPTTTTTSSTSQLASTSSANLLAGSEPAATGASQQEQDPQLVANRYLNSAIDALEAGQPFGAVDYDFEILNDNLGDRRTPGGSGGSAQQQQQQQRPTTHQAQPGHRQGSQSGGAGRSRQVQRLQQQQQQQLPLGANNRSALFNPHKQMDSATLRSSRLREEEEEERVSLANGQPVSGGVERPPGNQHHAISGGRGGQQLPTPGRHSFPPQPTKPLPSSSPVVEAAVAAATGAQLNQQQQPPSPTKKPRPTNKKIIVDHEQALANNRASVEPARRPDPLFTTPTALQTASKCDNRVCKLPDCKCGDTQVPGGLDPKSIPQVVLLTFDDAVNELNWEIYEELFTGRTNPNGCPILATFYVSHEWTDYGQVQTLYSRGHEIASHSVTHSFGEKFSKNQWFKEVNGQREILNMYGGVKMNDVRGMRAPFLQIGGNKMFEMLYDANFTYDSSMPIFDNLPPMWPYTLDYQLSHECMITPCPTKSFPGVWEVGMTMWVDLRGGRCSMGDACSNPADEDGVHEMLMKNFNRHYKSNRAPFGLFYHSAWFNTVHHRRGFLKFLGTVNAMSDVFFVTNWQMLQWMRKPTPLSEINSFEPWQCPAKTDRPPPCSRPSVCNVKSEHGTRFMKTCQPCPANHQYPWVSPTEPCGSPIPQASIHDTLSYGGFAAGLPQSSTYN